MINLAGLPVVLPLVAALVILLLPRPSAGRRWFVDHALKVDMGSYVFG